MTRLPIRKLAGHPSPVPLRVDLARMFSPNAIEEKCRTIDIARPEL